MKNILKSCAWAIVVLSVSAIDTSAQSSQPYAGMQSRPIKALSEQQVADLKAGRGMGLALAAELNGYPGPSHLLELSDQLGLTADQRSTLQGMFNAMKAETIPLGEQLLDQEERLDQSFAETTITERSLADKTTIIAETQGKLRKSHLRYHLLAREILQPSQITRYAELRGYQRPPGQMLHEHQHR